MKVKDVREPFIMAHDLFLLKTDDSLTTCKKFAEDFYYSKYKEQLYSPSTGRATMTYRGIVFTLDLFNVVNNNEKSLIKNNNVSNMGRSLNVAELLAIPREAENAKNCIKALRTFDSQCDLMNKLVKYYSDVNLICRRTAVQYELTEALDPYSWIPDEMVGSVCCIASVDIVKQYPDSKSLVIPFNNKYVDIYPNTLGRYIMLKNLGMH